MNDLFKMTLQQHEIWDTLILLKDIDVILYIINKIFKMR